MKRGTSTCFANIARARAMAAAGGIMLIAHLPLLRADSPAQAHRRNTAPGQLFGVHPVQEGRTTLPGGHFNFALVAGQRISDGIVVENFSTSRAAFSRVRRGSPHRDRRWAGSCATNRDDARGGCLDRRRRRRRHHRRAQQFTDRFTLTVPATSRQVSISAPSWPRPSRRHRAGESDRGTRRADNRGHRAGHFASVGASQPLVGTVRPRDDRIRHHAVEHRKRTAHVCGSVTSMTVTATCRDPPADAGQRVRRAERSGATRCGVEGVEPGRVRTACGQP